MRQASDFLMALQLTGAAKTDSIANLQVRLPVVVIGGGLTAIDTATEAMAYYPVQVEKFLAATRAWRPSAARRRCAPAGRAGGRASADEFIAHARALRRRARGGRARGSHAATSAALIRSWGGVTIAYRRRLIDAPSYTLNHEEVAKAMEEGIRFAEGLTPVAVELDASVRMRRRSPQRSRRSGTDTAGGRARWCCRRAPSWSPPAPSPTPCWRARTPTS